MERFRRYAAVLLALLVPFMVAGNLNGSRLTLAFSVLSAVGLVIAAYFVWPDRPILKRTFRI